ncbi:uncharacterized protein LOC123560963 [Mercenaria mercenaria]|uniref:uncharacterized protein LOC123560963 n=1 Tax=Mercenaria mercenaria TaxID=6596 RepID=UPI00234E8F76|nr:uncharacterized protein LOC123560963 [Mercenaria mercenaria]
MASNLNPDTDIRILLIGRTGHGKSSTGNTILGRNVFQVSDASTSETKTCMLSTIVKRFGRTVEVVDTPGMFDTDQHNHKVHKELLKSLALTTPGFHAIAFVLDRDKYTEEIQKTQDLFFDWFGPGVENFACVILTNTNDEATMNRYLKNKPHQKLTDLVNKCNGRIVPLNNEAPCDVTDGQVQRIFQTIEEIKRTNNNHHFSNVVFKLAEAYAKNKRPKVLTADSIHMLQTAGLQFHVTEKQCSYFDFAFDIAKKESNKDVDHLQDHSSYSESDDISQTEDTKYQISRTYGNLPIFDSSTNEPILNTPQLDAAKQLKQKRTYSSKEQDASSTCPRLPTLIAEVPGRIAGGSDKYHTENEIDYGSADVSSLSIESNRLSKGRKEEKIRQLQGKQTYDPPGHMIPKEIHENSRKVQEDGNRSQKPGGRRAGRVVDMSTVHFVPEDNSHKRTHGNQPSEGQNRKSQSSRANRVIDPNTVEYNPVNEFKNDINNTDEELNGFLDYIKEAWLYCKKKLCCIIL